MEGLDMTKIEESAIKFSINPRSLQALLESAVTVKQNAYCPYSNFRVGAALLASDGTSIIQGANVENASYPVGSCAERVALGAAVSSGFRKFCAIAVSTDIAPPASPCGMCRQFIREFCDPLIPIFMLDKDQSFEVMKLEELLPMSFGPEALPHAKAFVMTVKSNEIGG